MVQPIRFALTFLALLGLALAAPLAVAHAAGSSSGSSSSSSGGSSSDSGGTVEDAQAKIDLQNYKGAIKILDRIVKKDPKNADALNLLGYSHRKLGKTEKALAFYEKALAVNPKHRGANEYLGELYLEMNDLPKAEERLSVLASACSGCEELKELEEAIAKFKANNS